MKYDALSTIDELICDVKSLDNVYVNINDGNLGDALICYSCFNFLKKHNIKYNIITDQNFEEIKEPFDLILRGGGYFVKYYGYSHIKNNLFKHKFLRKCIILPSSFYECDDILQYFDNRFTIYCRDYVSYQYLINNTHGCNIKLFHDMAFIEDFNDFKNIVPKYDRLHVIRTGPEAVDIDLDMTNINSFDISTKYEMNHSKFNRKDLNFLCRFMFGIIGRYDTIVTNRLHVAICAYKMNKNIELYDNSYHKIKNVYDLSMSDYNKIITHF